MCFWLYTYVPLTCYCYGYRSVVKAFSIGPFRVSEQCLSHLWQRHETKWTDPTAYTHHNTEYKQHECDYTLLHILNINVSKSRMVSQQWTSQLTEHTQAACHNYVYSFCATVLVVLLLTVDLYAVRNAVL